MGSKGSARSAARDEAVRAAARLRSALRRFQVETERAARRHQLTVAQYELMIVVRSYVGVTMGTLAEQLVLSRQSVTELVTRAEEAGLLRRVQDTDDRRVVHVSLTPAGRRRFDRVFALLQGERERLSALLAELT